MKVYIRIDNVVACFDGSSVSLRPMSCYGRRFVDSIESVSYGSRVKDNKVVSLIARGKVKLGDMFDVRRIESMI